VSTQPVLRNVPIPIGDPIIKLRRPQYKVGEDPQEGTVTLPWIYYLTQQGQALDQSPSRIRSVGPLLTQGASIAATDMTGGGLNAGFYEIRYFAKVTRAATTSSSLIVTFDWTTGGNTLSQSFPAMTGNTVTTFQTDILPLIKVDASSPIRYSTTYASVGGTSMQYELEITLSVVQG
jgi:hypothetical protein